MYITYINLDRNAERRIALQNQLKKIGLTAQKLPATDGKSSDVIIDSTATSALSRLEKACAHSHRTALKKFMETDEEWCMVFEDDVEINLMVVEALKTVTALGTDNPTYIQLDYAPYGIKGIMLWILLFKNLFIKRKNEFSFLLSLPLYLVKFIIKSTFLLYGGARDSLFTYLKRIQIHRVYVDHYLAGAYIVNRKTAELLVDMNTPIHYAADRVHNVGRKEKKIRHYIVIPRIVRQRREDFLSELNNENYGNKVIAY